MNSNISFALMVVVATALLVSSSAAVTLQIEPKTTECFYEQFAEGHDVSVRLSRLSASVVFLPSATPRCVECGEYDEALDEPQDEFSFFCAGSPSV
jgi:hypothetical protein